MLNRRKFLAGVAAGVGAAKGEAPVRGTPLRANFWGPLYYDEKERQEVVDVLETGRPFRWYGPGTQPPMKVATFEKEFAAWMRTRYALAVTSGTAALHCALVVHLSSPPHLWPPVGTESNHASTSSRR